MLVGCVESLRRHDQLDNTLILFFSDNGCSGELDLFGMNWGKYTSNNYRSTSCGTSFSAPAVSGCVAVLMEDYIDKFGGEAWPSTVKALLIQGAEDQGNPGPDYEFGYGRVNIQNTIDIIRTDNGPPFASYAIGRISRLSVWWLKLGIYPELIERAHPEQNGRHERMHRTLKAETTRPPAANRRSQQRRFNSFQRTYNQERPHEALGQKTPASVYRPSNRTFSDHLEPFEYPSHFEVRRVSNNGGIRWHFHWVNVSHVLGGEYIGLEEVDNDLWNVYLGPLWLGRFHEKELKIEDALGRRRRRRRSRVLPMYPE